MKLNVADWIAFVLIIVGGLNWGLVGFFKWNLVDHLFGAGSALSRIVYALVGLAALYAVYALTKMAPKESASK